MAGDLRFTYLGIVGAILLVLAVGHGNLEAIGRAVFNTLANCAFAKDALWARRLPILGRVLANDTLIPPRLCLSLIHI